MAQHYKRRLIPIVDRAFQFKYTAIIVAVAAVISSVLGYLLLRSYLEMNEVADIAALSPEVGDKLNRDDVTRVFRITLVFLVAEVMVLGVMGLIITHRVAGPVAVLQRHFQTLGAGRYPKTRPLRAGDEFREAFSAFQAMIDEMKRRDASDADRLRAAVETARARGLSDAELAPLQALLDERVARSS